MLPFRMLAALAFSAIFASCLGPTEGSAGPAKPARAGRGISPSRLHWEKVADVDTGTGFFASYEVGFCSAERGVALADIPSSKRILFTVDGGAHWSQAGRDSGWNPFYVEAVDDSTLFLALRRDREHPERVARSVNGGGEWRTLRIGGDSALSLFHADRSGLVLVGQPGQYVDFHLSTDGGRTWKDWHADSSWFAPGGSGSLNRIFGQTDGKAFIGNKRIRSLDLATGVTAEVATLPDNSGQLIGTGPEMSGPDWIAFGKDSLPEKILWPYLIQSRDGGAEWDTLVPAHQALFTSLSLRGRDGLACASQYVDAERKFKDLLLWTADGGATWSESWADATPTFLTAVAWAGPGLWYGFDKTSVYRFRY